MAAVGGEEFGIQAKELQDLVSFDGRDKPEQIENFRDYGGVQAVAKVLKTDLEKGLTNIDESVIERRQGWFGRNFIDPPPSKTILGLIMESLNDVIMQVLLVGAVITLGVGTWQHPSDGWIEGVAIFVAVFIVVGVTAGNDYSKDKQFKKLLSLSTAKKVKVVRNGVEDQILSWDLLVGDLLVLATGDEVPADGLFVRGSKLVVDESPLTGESIPVKKDSEKAPFMFSGCQVSDGHGFMLVTTVGPLSTGGQIQALLNEAQEQETPLQEKLKYMAIQLGYVGLGAGLLTFIGLTIRWGIDIADEDWEWEKLEDLLEFFVVGVTIVVVAVPEGLPLAVTISLAFSMFKMIQDQNFVRHLAASETMGSATCICSDKTGTLTENRMAVTIATIAGKEHTTFSSSSSDSGMSDKVRSILAEGVCLNSTCFIQHKENETLPTFIGSSTEGALLILAKKLGFDYENVRKTVQRFEDPVFPFTSFRKRMSTFCRTSTATSPSSSSSSSSPEAYRLYTKGAAEIVIKLCTQRLSEDGSLEPMTEEIVASHLKTIEGYAREGLRTLCLAYRDFDELPKVPEASEGEDEQALVDNPIEKDLVLVGVVGIKDPVRPDVPAAVKKCQGAGLVVRMVTGDNALTATKISQECGILTRGGIVMEGPEFRNMTPEERRKVVPKLQVLARSSPADKFDLVTALQENNEVVAVTGDGTNDAPALKKADVGFAMGQSGTDIAMNASDIVLLDDNFSSIVNAIRWGRNVFDSIRKFLQFQISVNLVAILITFIGSVAFGESPLNPVQLLWVNLIMDSLGALALATDNPSPTILERKPHGRSDPLVTHAMLMYIAFQMVYQTLILCIVMFWGYELFDVELLDAADIDEDSDESRRKGVYTLVFTIFVLLQVANEVTARQLEFSQSLRKIPQNKFFNIIVVTILIIQILVVQFGGDFTRTETLNAAQWGGCILCAFISIPLCQLYRHFLRPKREVKDMSSHVIVEDTYGPRVNGLWTKTRSATFILAEYSKKNPDSRLYRGKGRMQRAKSTGAHLHRLGTSADGDLDKPTSVALNRTFQGMTEHEMNKLKARDEASSSHAPNHDEIESIA